MRVITQPISLIYGLIISIRNILFDLKILKSVKYDIPIICVGNISVGGTGKTPHVKYLIHILKKKNVCVLSRGYGRNKKGLQIVKDTSSFLDVGDEPLEIKKQFSNCTIVTCENRQSGIRYIKKKYPKTDIIIMDDGFQHRWGEAGLYIILNDYNNHIYNDKILPLGRLRDFTKELKRADIVITTKCPDQIDIQEKEEIIQKLNITENQKSFFSKIDYQDIKSIFNYRNKIKLSKELDVLLITSIANPNILANKIKIEVKSLTCIRFQDHHNYTKKDIHHILHTFNKIKSDKSVILTTEKDKVKLESFTEDLKDINIYFIPINITIDKQKEFKKEILKYVESN